jgi:multiple sugar transport system permease protein
MEAYYANPVFPIPDKLYLMNYQVALSDEVGAARWMANTVARILWYVAITGSIAVLAGYAFSRLRFRGREAAFLYLLAAMMMPPIVSQIPTYVILARFPLAGGNNLMGQGGHGFINEWPALLIPGLVNVYFIFLFRQSFASIQRDFEEAARVDGAGTLRILWQIYLPMLKPTLTVLAIFQSVGIWNAYQWPLIVSVGNRAIWTVALGAQQTMSTLSTFGGATVNPVITSGESQHMNYPFNFAVMTLVSVPTVLLFLALQRYFVEGLHGFAIKG